MTLRISRPARADLDETTAFIARDNEEASRKWLASILAKLSLIEAVPGMGATVAGRPSIRKVVHGRYLIIYRERRDGVTVLRVVHGARDQRRLL